MDLRPESEPNELELLSAARPEPTPDPAVAGAHRDALTAAMRNERISPRWRPVVRRVAIAAAAFPVLAGAAVLATQAPDEPGAGDAPDLQLASSSAFYDAPRCGTEPPPDLTIPGGYTGPIDGPSPDSGRAAAPDQLVRHWTSSTGSIELRWYADPFATTPHTAGQGEDGAPSVTTELPDVLIRIAEPPEGRPFAELVYGTEDGETEDPCTWTQLTVFGEDRAQVFGEVFEEVVDIVPCQDVVGLAEGAKPDREELADMLAELSGTCAPGDG